jgi:hypothetical protein
MDFVAFNVLLEAYIYVMVRLNSFLIPLHTSIYGNCECSYNEHIVSVPHKETFLTDSINKCLVTHCLDVLQGFEGDTSLTDCSFWWS